MQIKRLINSLFSVFFIVFISFLNINIVNAAPKIGTLVDCADSPAFNKRLDASVKKLETRLKKYETNTPPALALQQQIALTKSRFNRYGKSDLLCGKDGLPHLIVDGDRNHGAEFILPGLLFIYITGWIGWVGRKYLQTVSQTKNPGEKEIIIEIPLALQIMISGYIWPIYSWREFIKGNFVALKSEITVSPR
jgi:photosystem I subunit 3